MGIDVDVGVGMGELLDVGEGDTVTVGLGAVVAVGVLATVAVGVGVAAGRQPANPKRRSSSPITMGGEHLTGKGLFPSIF